MLSYENRSLTATNDQPNDSLASSKVQRSRLKPKTLSHVSRRTRLGRRIAQLTAIYVAALGDEALSPIKRLKVDAAAQLMALAELARGDYMRDAKGSLDDVVRIERKASAAERALGIVDKPRETRSDLDVMLDRAAR
jgi:hypothetical protein